MSYISPSAETISGELFDAVNRLADQRRKDELTFRRIERRAKDLMNADPSGAHAILGILGCLSQDIEELKMHHRLSVDLGRNAQEKIEAYSNYALSLRRSMLLDDAAFIYDEANNYFSGCLSLAELAFGANVERGAFGRAEHYLKLIKKYGGSENLAEKDEMLDAFLSFLSDHKIDEQELVNFVRRASMVCRNHSYLSEMEYPWLGRDDCEAPEFLAIKLNVDCTPTQSAALTEELANSIVETGGYDNVASRVAVSFVPA